MLETRKDLKDKVASAEAQLREQEEQLSNALATIESREEELCQLREDLAALQEANETGSAELTSAREKIDALEAALDEASTKLESFDDEVESAAAAKASQHLESLGHPPIALEGNSDDPSHVEENPAEHLTKIDDPAERFSYMKANRENVLATIFNK